MDRSRIWEAAGDYQGGSSQVQMYASDSVVLPISDYRIQGSQQQFLPEPAALPFVRQE